MSFEEQSYTKEIVYYDNLLKSNNDNTERVWELFKSYYKNKTGKEISITLNNIEELFIYDKDDKEQIFDDFMLFMIKVIITKIISNLNTAIEIFSQKGIQELSDDPKAVFTVFDRMIGQASTLLNLYQKLQEKIDILNNEKERNNSKFNFKKID